MLGRSRLGATPGARARPRAGLGSPRRPAAPTWRPGLSVRRLRRLPSACRCSAARRAAAAWAACCCAWRSSMTASTSAASWTISAGLGGSGVLAGERGAGQQPGGLAQAGARRGGPGYPRVGHPGGPGVGVRRLADHPAAQRGGRGVQGVGCRPGGVAGRSRVAGGAAHGSDRGHSARSRAACSQIAFRSAAVSGSLRRGPGAVASQRQRSLGRLRSAASFPPPNHTGPPARAVSPPSATA